MMKPEAILWSALHSAMRPLAQRAYRDLKDIERSGAAATPADAAAAFRDQLEQALQSTAVDTAPPGPVAAAALGEGFDGVFSEARRGAAWYFRLHLVMAIGMVVIFLGGAGGAV